MSTAVRLDKKLTLKALIYALFQAVIVLNGFALVDENSAHYFLDDPEYQWAACASLVSEGRENYRDFLAPRATCKSVDNIESVVDNFFECRPLVLADNESTLSIKFKGDPDYRLFVFPERKSACFRAALKLAGHQVGHVWWFDKRYSAFPELQCFLFVLCSPLINVLFASVVMTALWLNARRYKL